MRSLPEFEMILARLDQIESRLVCQRTPWMSTSEAAEFIRASTSLIEKLTRAGKIPFYRQNPNAARSSRLYHRRDLTDFLITGKNAQADQLSQQEKKEVERLLI